MGDHCFLKMVTMAQMKPPKTPRITQPPMAAGLPEARYWNQVQAAEANVRMRRMPVLLTVPLRVMRAVASIRLPPYPLPGTLRKVFSPRAGFEVFIKAMICKLRVSRALHLA